MNTYFIVTDEGQTYDKNGTETENAQIIGIIAANTAQEALEKFTQENSASEGFDLEEVHVYRVVRE